MLWSDKAKLQACEKLKQAGITFPMVPGAQVARGFADLGYEEFVIIAEGQIVSLLTGVRGEMPAGHAGHFFVVPSVDQLCDELATRRWLLERAEFVDQRLWKVAARYESTGKILEQESERLDLSLLKLSLASLAQSD